MSIKRCLILTASYGSGHNAAKNALKNALEHQGVEVQSLDMVTLLKNMGGKSSKKFYEISEFFPIMWKIMFAILDKELSNDVLTSAMKVVAQTKFDAYIESYKPDCVIAVFPLWAKLIQNYCSNHPKTFTTSVVVTDSMDVGMGWYFWNEIIDRFFVIDKHTKRAIEKKFEHKKNNITVSFFPIDPRYFYDKKSLSSERVIILLTGMKKKFSEQMLLSLVRESSVKHVTILQGRNKRLFTSLKSVIDHPKCEFLEFVNLKEVMKDNDIMIAKPGWALMCECIAQDVLLVSPCYIPGQEEGNIAFMKKARVGIYEEKPEAIIALITSPKLSKYCEYFKKIKNCNAIRDILNEVEKIGR